MTDVQLIFDALPTPVMTENLMHYVRELIPKMKLGMWSAWTVAPSRHCKYIFWNWICLFGVKIFRGLRRNGMVFAIEIPCLWKVFPGGRFLFVCLFGCCFCLWYSPTIQAEVPEIWVSQSRYTWTSERLYPWDFQLYFCA